MPADDDLLGVEIARAVAGGDRTTVYTGVRRTFVDRSVRRGVTYAYTITSVDLGGNRSGGIERTIRVPLLGLLAPAAGSSVAKRPVLTWTSVPRATYYNVQLWRGGKKILSTWPAKPRLVLKARWTFAGKAVRLGRGTYRWFVWPGFASRADAKYGKLLGTRTFVMRR